MFEEEPRQDENGDRSDFAGDDRASNHEHGDFQGNQHIKGRQAAQGPHHKDPSEIRVAPHTEEFKLGPLVPKLQALLSEHKEIYLVGGAVRDALLGKTSHDLDFTVPSKALPIARKMADHLGGAYYRLGDEYEIGRVVLPQEGGRRHILDFANLRGPDLESDLRGRDFTINAMALDLRALQDLIDPLGGLMDLRAKRLKACSSVSFAEDPVRIIRAIRFAVSSNFAIDFDTKQWMRSASELLPGVSPERIRDELFRILSGPRPAAALRMLDTLGALPYLLPEMESLRGVAQSPPHIYDVWEHSLQTVHALEKVLAALDAEYDEDTAKELAMGEVVLRLGRFRNAITEIVEHPITPERNWRPSLFLAALYHDIGKPAKRTRRDDERIAFIGHELHSAEIIEKRARALQLSNTETKRLKTIAANHMRPFYLVSTGKLPSRRAIYRYFKATGEVGVDVALISIADMLAIYGTTLPFDLLIDWITLVRELLDAWFEQASEKVLPPAIVDGEDLMRVFELPPGPQIGHLLEAIREAQAAGEVADKKSALALARRWIEETK